MASLRKPLRGLLFAALALVLALALGEIVVRRLSDAQLGFAFVAGVFVNPDERVGEAFSNSLGFHAPEPAPKAPGVERVLLLGDSYVAGLAVRVEDTVGVALERALNSRAARGTAPQTTWDVVAAGQPGWGQHQELEALRTYGALWQPDCVLLLFLSFNDVRNNAPAGPLRERAQAEFARLDRQRPGWTHLRAQDAPGLWFPHSKLNQLLSHRWSRWRGRDADFVPLDYFVYATPVATEWEAAWSETERLLLALRQECESRGARFLIASASTPHGILGPSRGTQALIDAYPGLARQALDLELPDRRLGALAAREGIAFLALEEPLRKAAGSQAHLRYDGHWSAMGHAEAGKLLAEFVLGSR